MKEQQRLLQEIALMLEHQDMLSKLTESQCLDEYGYSETHCIDNIGRLELPNVTKIAEQMQLLSKRLMNTGGKKVYDDEKTSCKRSDRKIHVGDK